MLKRLDTFILSKFLQLFAAAFFVCLFVFMMQFTWRYIDDLVGKGLTLDILAQFFGYMALTLVPQALPMSVLLASLITFGNMGENLELLSMKAAGVPLTRIMRPLVFLVFLLAGVSFYFQNKTAPDAQKNLRQLLISMKQSQPAVEIPEGIFYNGVPQLNLFVERKNVETGMLYNVIIYKTDAGFDQAQIVIADSAHLEVTADKMHLRLALWSGCEFEDPKYMMGNGQQNINLDRPFARQTFRYKEFLKEFDSNFNLMDGDLLTNMPQTKNMREIEHDADSMSVKLDSTGLAYVDDLKYRMTLQTGRLTKEDSVRLNKEFKAHPVKIDEIFKKASKDQLSQAKTRARSNIQQMSYDLEWKEVMNDEGELYIRRHWIEWHTKITLSLACILFFFVGAPVGAIVRKGGLGTPSIISVIIFIIYYLINTFGMKMAREGNINMVLGMWISTMILFPAGVYLTFMSNRDSQVFNVDAYRNFFRKIFGIRVKRNIYKKEVIIEHPNYAAGIETVAALRHDLKDMRVSRMRMVNYLRYRKSTELKDFVERIEKLIEELSNSRDLLVLQQLNRIPYISKRHLRKDKRLMLSALEKLEARMAVLVENNQE